MPLLEVERLSWIHRKIIRIIWMTQSNYINSLKWKEAGESKRFSGRRPRWIPRWRGIQSAITTLKMEEEDQEVANVRSSRRRKEP